MANELFMGNDSLEWMGEKYILQMEVQCGPRTIWAMAVLIGGCNRNKNMEDIRNAIFKLEERGFRIMTHQVRQSTK